MPIKTPFKKAVESILERHDHDRSACREVCRRIETEEKIVKKLIKLALNEDWYISVNGENEVVSRSRVFKTIINATFSTDQDWLQFYNGEERIGFVRLVYGNSGHDVINDYGAPKDKYDTFEAWMKTINDYCDGLE